VIGEMLIEKNTYVYYVFILLVLNLRAIHADVFVLTDTNFSDEVKTCAVALVMFYVPW